MTSETAVQSRPARRQVDESILRVGPQQRNSQGENVGGSFYNIWYNRWSGGDRGSHYARAEKAKYRCNPALDSGSTKGDKMTNTYFCIYFARGCCPFGHECNYWHRIPNSNDPVDSTIDAFGRDKFSEYRDDMGGVGSFNRENRTLYVGHVYINPEMEEIVRRHFSEWGAIEKVKILRDKGVAFVTYESSLNAEFAKEAMSNQGLDHDEMLNVRWATDDPNPRAKAEYKRKAELMAAQALQKSLPAEFTVGHSENKRAKLEEGDSSSSHDSQSYQAPYGPDQYSTQEHAQEQYNYPEYGYGHYPQYGYSQAPADTNSDGSILSAQTLQALQTIRQTMQPATSTTTKTELATRSGGNALAGLADYGSDDEEDDDDLTKSENGNAKNDKGDGRRGEKDATESVNRAEVDHADVSSKTKQSMGRLLTDDSASDAHKVKSKRKTAESRKK